MGRSETPRRYQLDAGYWAARGRFRSNPANACAPVRGVPFLPQEVSPTRTGPSRGVQDLAGDPGLQALLSRFSLVGVLEMKSSNQVPQNGSLGNLGAALASVGSPKDTVQPFPVEYPMSPLQICKFRVACLGNVSVQVHGGPYVAAPRVFQRAGTWTPEGGRCVCADLRARRCQYLETIWVQTGLFCACVILTHVSE